MSYSHSSPKDAKISKISIQDQFLNAFAGRDEINTKEILEWYISIKRGVTNHAYYTSIFQLIINPLMRRDLLVKKSKGIYSINFLNIIDENENENEHYSNESTEENLDDLDLYIKNKLNQNKEDLNP
jgi:hypothetical protein